MPVCSWQCCCSAEAERIGRKDSVRCRTSLLRIDIICQIIANNSGASVNETRVAYRGRARGDRHRRRLNENSD